jgi:hypothetical protein
MVPGGDPEEIEIKKENDCFLFLSPGFEIYRVVVIEHNQ